MKEKNIIRMTHEEALIRAKKLVSKMTLQEKNRTTNV